MRRPETYTARRLRRLMTLPEVLVWERLRGGAVGVKFRRQHPLGAYVADFCCVSLRLVVEIDGSAHDMGQNPSHDAARDHWLGENGYTVLRVPARDVLENLDRVIEMIAHAANPLHHQPAAGGPPPRAGEDF
jgi:very-short-patch-repair endonuclease